MKPFVSVLLPVYNGAGFVRKAIESVLAQDYDNFEFIILDNASTDQTPLIIKEYASDRRIKALVNNKTVSRLENFSLVFEAADKKSRWYKFIGDDDRLLPGCLAEMVQAGEAHESAGLVCSYYYNGETLVKGALEEEQKLVSGPAILRRMLLDPEARSTIFSPASLLIAPAAFREMGGFRTDLLHADAELFYRILNRYDLAYVHSPLVQIGYHESSGQAESTAAGVTFSEAYLIYYRNLKLYDRLMLRPLEVARIKNNLVNDSFGFMLSRLAKGDIRGGCGHIFSIPPGAIYHLPLSACYFIFLAVKKLLRRERFSLFAKSGKKD